MIYTITQTTDFATNQSIEIEKFASIYSVNFTDGKTYITKKVKTIDEAQAVYQKIVNYFIHGVYNFEQRAEELMEV